MNLFQGLAQAAAGSKYETMVAGVAIQMTNAIQGTAHVKIIARGWGSIVLTFCILWSGNISNTFASTRQSTVPLVGQDSQLLHKQPGRPPTTQLAAFQCWTCKNQAVSKNCWSDMWILCFQWTHKNHILSNHGWPWKKLSTLGPWFLFCKYRPLFKIVTRRRSNRHENNAPRKAHHLFSTIDRKNGGRPQFLDALVEAKIIGTGGLPLPG